MDQEDFDGIVAGLEDAIAFAKGDASRGRVVAGTDVKAIRRRTKLTQHEFASAFGLPLGTVRDWEQGRRQPETGSRLYLRLIETDHGAVRDLLARA